MGLIRFAVHSSSLPQDWPEVHRGYLSGADGRIFPTRIEFEGGVVTARRSTSESSKFHVAWPVQGYGRPMLRTASLPEREEPYQLLVELARGELVHLRNQSAAWELSGMQLPPDFRPAAQLAHQAFARAAVGNQTAESSARAAEECLMLTCRAAEILCQSFTEQALNGRQQRWGQLPALLGCGLSKAPDIQQADLFTAAFNTATIPISWTQIERVEGEYSWDSIDEMVTWAETHRLLPRGGPLVDLGPGGLPNWLAQWEHDVFNLQSFVCDFVETAMSRYVGRIRLWDVVARFNTGGALTLNEEVRLSLAARVLEIARQVDEEAQLILRIDQPWGEYQARGQHRLSPLQLVDALIRSGIGLAGVNLEIAVGYQPRGTPYRGLLEYSRLIDLWSALGVPLHITLASPSVAIDDPLALPDLEVDAGCWPGGCNELAQASWLERLVPMLMAKPAVASVLWNAFSDAEPHEYPASGLLDAEGRPKPALETLIHFRQRLLRRS